MKARNKIPDKPMLLESVDFNFRARNGEEALTIRFCYKKGKPTVIKVYCGDGADPCYVEDNAKHHCKPCVTHCRDLLRRLTHKPPQSEFSKQRAAKAKPALKIHG